MDSKLNMKKQCTPSMEEKCVLDCTNKSTARGSTGLFHLLGHGWNTASSFGFPSSRETLTNWGWSNGGHQDEQSVGNLARRMVERIGFVLPREKQTQAFQHLKGGYRGDVVTLFTRVHSDNTNSNRHKLVEGNSIWI